MALIGASEQNSPLLEACYRRVLDAFEPHAGLGSYLFGTRPSLADFAWYGQLSQLALDPTPMAIMREHAPKTEIWTRRLDDASGVDGHWATAEAALVGATTALLSLAGEVYLPFLAANAEAYGEGRDSLSFKAWDLDFSQPPFRYQVKCFERLRAIWSDLGSAERARIEPLLRRTGCLAYL